MPVDFMIGLGAVASGITIAEASKKIATKGEMLQLYLKDGSQKIAILGSGGVGKTSLSLLLSGRGDEISFEYNESQGVERQKLSRNIIGQFIIGPGQPRRIKRYWPEILRDLASGKIKGIINVVSYGYHSIGGNITLSDIDYYADGMSNDDFMRIHMEKSRKKEIKLLEEIKSSVKISKGKFWMLTVVNKQDLWLEESTENEENVKNKVEKFYKTGEYNSIISEIETQKGKQNFLHEYVSLSTIINNFSVNNGIIKKTSRGYDQRIQVANHLNVLNTLESLIKS